MRKAVLVIDMPKSCDVCDFTDMANGKIYCGVPGCGKNTADYIVCRPDWCPLVPVLENEAIETLITENCYECSYGSESAVDCGNKNCEVSKAAKVAINALREVQQYRVIGTVEELKTMKENGAFSGAELAQICAMQMKLKEYQSIGTVEECKASVDKMKPKKTIKHPNEVGSMYRTCSVCRRNTSIRNRIDKFCSVCGQAVEVTD